MPDISNSFETNCFFFFFFLAPTILSFLKFWGPFHLRALDNCLIRLRVEPALDACNVWKSWIACLSYLMHNAYKYVTYFSFPFILYNISISSWTMFFNSQRLAHQLTNFLLCQIFRINYIRLLHSECLCFFF